MSQSTQGTNNTTNSTITTANNSYELLITSLGVALFATIAFITCFLCACIHMHFLKHGKDLVHKVYAINNE
jgi:hypothetical protein